MKKIGLLGGSFNPIHIGHLILANTVLESLQLDFIIFIPCNIQPLKPESSLIDANARLEMIKLAIENNNKFSVSDIEINRGGKSYTIETIKYFKNLYDDLYFIIGADNIKDFDNWKDPDDIILLAKIVVTNRGGIKFSLPQKLRDKEVLVIKIPNIEISSTDIRERIKNNKSIKYFVPEKVEEFILNNNLYK